MRVNTIESKPNDGAENRPGEIEDNDDLDVTIDADMNETGIEIE